MHHVQGSVRVSCTHARNPENPKYNYIQNNRTTSLQRCRIMTSVLIRLERLWITLELCHQFLKWDAEKPYTGMASLQYSMYVSTRASTLEDGPVRCRIIPFVTQAFPQYSSLVFLEIRDMHKNHTLVFLFPGKGLHMFEMSLPRWRIITCMKMEWLLSSMSHYVLPESL